LLILIIPCVLSAQVEVYESVIFTGTESNERQIFGLSDPLKLSDAVNTRTIQYSKLNFALTGGSENNIELILPVAPDTIIPGLQVHFLASYTNTGPVTVNINNTGAKSLLKDASLSLDSAEIIPGQMLSAIFDGTVFQVISDLNIPCPFGFIEIAKDYCIEKKERGPATFWNAIRTCGDLGGKLCDWSDWFYACQHDIFGNEIENMTDNWEWADSGGNNTSTAVPLLSNTVNVLGNGSCTARGTSPIQTSDGLFTLNYHCCFKKRP
jgi:hypothetical protein